MAEAHRCTISINNKLIYLDSLIKVESVRYELSRHSCGARREGPFVHVKRDVDAKQATLSSRDVKLRDEECLQNWENANLLN